MGPPGSGKGSQARSIAEQFNIPHVSSGDIFREIIEKDLPHADEIRGIINRGDLVPDDMTIKIIFNRLNQDDCNNGWILDGFPRTVNQAIALDKALSDHKVNINAVIHMDIRSSIVIERMKNRVVCQQCGETYNLVTKPTKVAEVCDLCGGVVKARSDDFVESIIKRLDEFEKRTQPLLNYYSDKGLLETVQAENSIEDVYNQIISILGVYQ